MDKSDLILIKPGKEDKVYGNKKKTAVANSFKKLYQAAKDRAVKREKEEENRKKIRLNIIIQKLLAGIMLTSDELQFLKQNAPVYYNQAMRQQRNRQAKSAGQSGVGEIEPIGSSGIV